MRLHLALLPILSHIFKSRKSRLSVLIWILWSLLTSCLISSWTSFLICFSRKRLRPVILIVTDISLFRTTTTLSFTALFSLMDSAISLANVRLVCMGFRATEFGVDLGRVQPVISNRANSKQIFFSTVNSSLWFKY